MHPARATVVMRHIHAKPCLVLSCGCDFEVTRPPAGPSLASLHLFVSLEGYHFQQPLHCAVPRLVHAVVVRAPVAPPHPINLDSKTPCIKYITKLQKVLATPLFCGRYLSHIFIQFISQESAGGGFLAALVRNVSCISSRGSGERKQTLFRIPYRCH